MYIPNANNWNAMKWWMHGIMMVRQNEWYFYESEYAKVFRRRGWLWMILNAIKRKPNVYSLLIFVCLFDKIQKKINNNNKYITRQKHKHKIIFKWVHNIPSARKEEEEWVSRTTAKPRANKHQVKWNCCWKEIFSCIFKSCLWLPEARPTIHQSVYEKSTTTTVMYIYKQINHKNNHKNKFVVLVFKYQPNHINRVIENESIYT